jgi:hypothetical protein
VEHAPRSYSQAQRFRGPTQAAQAVDSAGVGTRGVAGLMQLPIQVAGAGVVFEGGLMLAQQAMRIATDLSRGGLVFLVAVRIRDGYCFVGSVERLSGTTNQVGSRTLQQLVDANLPTPLRGRVGESRHFS